MSVVRAEQVCCAWARVLTEEAEGPPHQRVEVAAVPGGHRLLRPVKLFGRVLDQEQHRLGDCDLVRKTHK